MRRSTVACVLPSSLAPLILLGLSLASPSVASAQTAVAPVEEEREPSRSRRVREAEEEPWTQEQAEARQRRRNLVQRDEPSGEDDGSYYDGGRDAEPYDPQARERARHTGGGVSARSVGLALTISGLVVGLTGAAVGVAGTAAEDKTTTIVGAFIGLGGGALSVTGLIINLTASSGAQAAADPALGVAIGPGSASLFGSF
jgi:hypothetical protein